MNVSLPFPLPTDISLIKNNAKVGAQIAVALRDLKADKSEGGGKQQLSDKSHIPIVIGGSILDVHYRVLDDNLEVSSALVKNKLKAKFSPQPQANPLLKKKNFPAIKHTFSFKFFVRFNIFQLFLGFIQLWIPSECFRSTKSPKVRALAASKSTRSIILQSSCFRLHISFVLIHINLRYNCFLSWGSVTSISGVHLGDWKLSLFF